MGRDKSGKEERKKRRRERAEAAAASRLDPAEVLGDIDAWNLRAEAGWLRFDARLEEEPRAYLRRTKGGDILADAPGPLTAILGLGGARRAGFTAGPPRFRYNVLGAADHIGAVGLEGTGTALSTPDLQHLPHRSREALIADHLLGWRRELRQGPGWIVARVETDASASVAALAQGTAFTNFLTGLDNLVEAAARLGRRPRVLAVTLGYGLEDLASDPVTFAQDFRALMARIEAEMRKRDLVPPVFLAEAESGTARYAAHPAVAAFHSLAWCPGPHRLILSTPSYAAAQDGFGRPTDTGRSDLAELDAHALRAALAGEEWICPTPLLAEYCDRRIRVVFRAQSDLVIDPADPHRAGPAAGFGLADAGEGCEIRGLTVAPDDSKALILDCSAPPQGGRLRHAFDLPPAADDGPINRSAVRDSWSATAASGNRLNRWAVPADLPLHPASALCVRGEPA